MQQISDTSRDSLYDTVHGEVMDARVKIEKLNIDNKYIKEQIDKIMFTLSCSAPQSAISCFNYRKER